MLTDRSHVDSRGQGRFLRLFTKDKRVENVGCMRSSGARSANKTIPGRIEEANTAIYSCMGHA
jgi:hypothetical protein